MTVPEAVKAMGVVGAGGGGFPTHVKLSRRVEVVIANGAECEPLLGNDKLVMEEEAEAVVAGLCLAMEATGARKGVIALKGRGSPVEEALRKASQGKEGLSIFSLGDYYPAGDEFLLVREVTGRIVPEGGIPPSVGVVVLNVETLRNIARAVEGKPVIERTLTCQGEVRRPSVLRVRVGTPFEKVLEYCGGATVDDFVLLVGGPMMGLVTTDLKAPVTKTTSGLFVLPRDHVLVQKKTLPLPFIIRQSKTACCQCTYCTEFCPGIFWGMTWLRTRSCGRLPLGLMCPLKSSSVRCSAASVACVKLPARWSSLRGW
jgi:Na+-translocating ferredoxin:NAD+ oxidoreductase RnfC subunit